MANQSKGQDIKIEVKTKVEHVKESRTTIQADGPYIVTGRSGSFWG